MNIWWAECQVTQGISNNKLKIPIQLKPRRRKRRIISSWITKNSHCHQCQTSHSLSELQRRIEMKSLLKERKLPVYFYDQIAKIFGTKKTTRLVIGNARTVSYRGMIAIWRTPQWSSNWQSSLRHCSSKFVDYHFSWWQYYRLICRFVALAAKDIDHKGVRISNIIELITSG